MPTSTLTTRGQTTIPKPIQEALGLQLGDRVEFTFTATEFFSAAQEGTSQPSTACWTARDRNQSPLRT